MNKLSYGALEHLSQAAQGLDGGSLRRIFHRLGYDYADDYLPSLPADSLAARYVCRRPHRIASAFGKQFSVLWFSVSVSSEDAFRPSWSEAEKALLAWAWERYAHGLILFSDPSGVFWRVACSASADAIFAFDVSNITRQVKIVWEQWSIDDADEWTTEPGASGLLEHVQKCVMASQSAALRPALSAQASVRAARETARTAVENKKADAEAEDGSGTALGSYLPRLTRTPLLTAQKEAELVRRAQSGDLKARDHLVEANVRLVINIATKYLWSEIPLEDLVQEGVIGLIRATERYDAKRGYRFSTYATHWIRQGVGRAVECSARMIRLPSHLQETHHQITKARAALGYYEEEDAALLALKTGLPVEKVKRVLEAHQPVLSLDSDVGESQTAKRMQFYADEASPDPAMLCIEAETCRVIEDTIEMLRPHEQQVVQMRCGFFNDAAYTLQEVGDAIGRSRERARQIETRAHQRLVEETGLVAYLTNTEHILAVAPFASYEPTLSASLPPAPRLTPEAGKTPLHYLGLTTDATKKLISLGFDTVEKAADVTDAHLRVLPGFGPKRIAQFWENLAAFQHAQQSAVPFIVSDLEIHEPEAESEWENPASTLQTPPLLVDENGQLTDANLYVPRQAIHRKDNLVRDTHGQQQFSFAD